MTYCDFKVGDEVAKRADPTLVPRAGQVVGSRFREGEVLVVADVLTHPSWGDVIGLRFAGVSDQHPAGYDSRCFRKVERKPNSLSIESFLTIKPGFEEPRREPAKTPERVQ